MKPLIYVLVALSFMLIGTAQAQDRALLSIEENNNGKMIPVSIDGPQIVEINGKLEITLNKDKILQRIKDSYPQLSSQLVIQNKIDKLETALADKQKLLNLLDKNIRNAADDRALNDAMLTFLNLAFEPGYEFLETQYDALYYEWDSKYGSNVNTPVKMEAYILSKLNTDLIQERLALKSIDNTKYSLSMVAFLKDKKGKNKDNDKDRVHIENFDNYAEQGFYEVERWVTALSSEQQTQLASMQETTAQMNVTSFNIFNDIKAKLSVYLEDLKCITTLKKEVETFLKKEQVVSSITAALQTDANNLLAEFDSYTAILSTLKGDVSSWTIDTVFQVLTQLQQVETLINDLPALIAKFKETAAAITVIAADVSALVTKIDACYTIVKAKVILVANSIGLLKNQQSNYLSSDLIGKEVLAFGIDNLPAKGYINLVGAGLRASGDQLEIDFLLRLPKSSVSDADNGTPLDSTVVNHVLERRMLTMRLIGFRSETAVGIIMANPFNYTNPEEADQVREFFYAPSASLLVKFGSRTSKFYNDFIDMGFGLNIATPDFNTDGTPEFGFGAILTAFKNILSVGINYNVTLDEPYWSIGINLPFNLPGIPINGPR